MNYQNQGPNYLLKPKAEAGTVRPTRGFDNSHYHAKTEFVNCFNIHFTKKIAAGHLPDFQTHRAPFLICCE